MQNLITNQIEFKKKISILRRESGRYKGEKMCANLMKSVLLAFSIFLIIASDYSCYATKAIVKNNLEQGQTLTLSCTYYTADKRETTKVAGVLGSNQAKELSLDPNVTKTVTCKFAWGSTSHSFDVYSEYRDEYYCITECTYSIKQDSVCKVDPNDSNIIYYCDPWN